MYDSFKFGLLRAVLDNGPLRVAHLSILRSLERTRPGKSQLVSIELPKYAHWAVLPLHYPVRHSTLPYVSGRASCSSCQVTHARPLFTRTGLDQVRLLPQLSVHSSCDIVERCKLQIMRTPLLPLGEWFMSLTRRTGFVVMCLLSVPCSIYPF